MTREDLERLKAGSGVGSRANLERLAKEYVGMNYTDFTKGDSYKDLEKRFVDQGRQAMDDTVGRVAARTGGIASSYATQAGEQAYGGWMEKLEDTARELYDTERQKKLDEFGIAQKLYAQDYQEKRDQQSDLERNSELTLEWDQYKKSTAEENLYSDILHGGEGDYDAYKKSGGILDESSYDRIVNSAKDVLEDERTKDETDAKENAIEKIKNHLSVGTPPDLIDSSLITASGYDKDYWERWRNANAGNDGGEPEFRPVSYEDVIEWEEKMRLINSRDEAESMAATIAAATGNTDFADSLYAKWLLAHGMNDTIYKYGDKEFAYK